MIFTTAVMVIYYPDFLSCASERDASTDPEETPLYCINTNKQPQKQRGKRRQVHVHLVKKTSEQTLTIRPKAANVHLGHPPQPTATLHQHLPKRDQITALYSNPNNTSDHRGVRYR